MAWARRVSWPAYRGMNVIEVVVVLLGVTVRFVEQGYLVWGVEGNVVEIRGVE